jgi:ABC-type nitrate/sulfonate/bicarbonate transport system substrate-binding protein
MFYVTDLANLTKNSANGPGVWKFATFATFVMFFGLVFVTACGGGSGGSGGEQTVTVQLDWTPNTNHTGIYVGLAKGWYKDAGIKVNILPYTDVNPDVVVANGKADIGFSFPPNVVFSRAQGLDVVSVASVLQKGVTELAVLDSSDIKRPKDLDGRLYAGFGLPYEEPVIKTVITTDGGKGTFRSATLSTAAYEALYNKRADFTEIFVTWEGIEADIRGIKLRTFKPDQFGVPDHPAVVLIAKGDAVSKRKATLQKFLDVTRRGYEFAQKSPEEAAKVFAS